MKNRLLFSPGSWLTHLFGLLVFGLMTAACSERPEPTGSDEPDRSSQAVTSTSELTVILNARLHTFDQENTSIESGAMAFDASGRIVGIGELDPMLARFPGARQVDLQGKTVLPGLIDSHGHLHGLAVSFTRANLVGAASKREVMDRLREFAADLPEGEWLLGRGWDQNDWPEQVFPDRQDLDAEFPDRPVWLRRIDGHAAWANSVAMDQADVDLGGDWQEEGGYVHGDANGPATGIFIDGDMQST